MPNYASTNTTCIRPGVVRFRLVPEFTPDVTLLQVASMLVPRFPDLGINFLGL